MAYVNRRRFLQTSAAGFLGATGVIAGLGQSGAFASDAGGYKALVGIFLKGGADMFDAVLPYDRPSYAAFSRLRPGVLSSHPYRSRARENLLALRPSNASAFGGRQFALTPELAPLKAMFDRGEMALIGSVGPLLSPTTRRGVETGRAALPNGLFSHNDQQACWMAASSRAGLCGWGGRFMDEVRGASRVARSEGSLITAGSSDIFLASEGVQQIDALSMCDDRAGVSMSIPFPNTRLGQQLNAISAVIQNRGVTGINRQIFYADMGGFDTHHQQGCKMAGLLGDVAQSMAAFRAALIQMGAWESVTTFTMSDFGRTLTDVGDGTDHGWGSHHFVMGGSVQGGRIYGSLPELDPASERFTESRLIPSVSVETYAAALGRWFGLDRDEITRVLPHLDRFDASTMGFMGGVSV